MRQIKLLSLAVAVLLAVPVLTSCRVLDDLSNSFGNGRQEYSGEKPIGSVPLDGEIADEMRSMIKMLSIDSVKLPEFDNMKDAVTMCHDSLLNYMLYTDYAKYAGNPTLLSDAEKEYPSLYISEIIPASEFESMMYRYFGGNVKISHGDTRAFKYLSRVQAYVPIGHPISDAYDVAITEISETENTYLVAFTCSNGKRSMSYESTVVKREDGTMYFASVMRK